MSETSSSDISDDETDSLSNFENVKSGYYSPDNSSNSDNNELNDSYETKSVKSSLNSKLAQSNKNKQKQLKNNKKTSTNNKKTSKQPVTGTVNKIKRAYNMNNRKASAKQKQLKTNLIENSTSEKQPEPIQCQGPGCTNAVASLETKYCSLACGLNLAKQRLHTIFEPNFKEMEKMNSLADIYNRDQLEKCDADISTMRLHLIDLEKKHQDLDSLVERAKLFKIDANVEHELEKRCSGSEGGEVEIFCVTCGYTCSERHALKHMDKCFNKIESQAFFGSFYKSNIDDGHQSIFCDFFNTQTKMYCKRLRVMCSEHQKEKRNADANDEVCGCSLAKYENLHPASGSESIDDGNICLAAKRTCPVHFKWEKLKRAQIDLEKLRTVRTY